MTKWLSSVEVAVVFVILIKAAAAFVGVSSARERRPSIWAPILWAGVAIPTLAQVVWPSLLGALRSDPTRIGGGEWWRLLSSIIIQDGGLSSAAFNLISLAIVAVLATWTWGGPRAIAIFLAGGIGLNALATAYGSAAAGSSGATLVLLASIAGCGVVRRRGSLRRRAVLAITAGGPILALGNPHGIAVLAGGLLGMGLSLGWSAPVTEQGDSNADPDATVDLRIFARSSRTIPGDSRWA